MDLLKSMPVKYKNLVSASLDVRDLTIESLFVDEIWTREDYFQYGLKLSPNDVVLDVGGHIGIFTVLASKLAKRVYTYEPVRSNYEILMKNIVTNGCLNVTPFNMALTVKDGFFVIQIPKESLPDRNTGLSFIGNSANPNWFYGEKVVGLRFADVVQGIISKHGFIDFLKLDIEGMEYDLLHSLTGDQFSNINQIALEFHTVGFVHMSDNSHDPELMAYTKKQGDDLAEFLHNFGYDAQVSYSHGRQGRLHAKRIKK